MFAMKITEENAAKIAERCTDWTADEIEEVIKDPANLKHGALFAVHDFDSEHVKTFNGSVIITQTFLDLDFTYEPSDTDWFEITRK